MLDRGKLARGLETILGNIAVEEMPGSSSSRVLHVDPNLVQPNPHQPRKNFDPQTIKSLTESIREHGLLQPILVRPGKDGGYRSVHHTASAHEGTGWAEGRQGRAGRS